MAAVRKVIPGADPARWNLWRLLSKGSKLPVWVEQIKCIEVDPEACKWRIILDGSQELSEEMNQWAQKLTGLITGLSAVEVATDTPPVPNGNGFGIPDDEFDYMEMVTRMAASINGGENEVVKENGNGGKKGEILLGRRIAQEPVSMESIEDEENTTTVAGRVINLNIRDMRTGRRLVTFDLADETAGLSVKVFEEKDKEISEQISEGMWLKVRGPVQYDAYTQELTMMARDINTFTPKLRMDNAEGPKRVELHLHTKMSAMDGTTDLADAIKTAARWGHPAVAITDHGVVQAFPEAYSLGKKYGVKIIYGMEGYLIDDESRQARYHHVIILAKNMTGLRNLYRLVSFSHLDYFYRRPRIPRELLSRYREGLILGSACEAGELYRALLDGASDERIVAIASFYDYLEIQPLGNNQFLVGTRVQSEEDLKNINRKIVELGKRLGKPVVATGDVHFLEPGDEIYRRILMAGQGYEDAERQAPLYYRTTEEMSAEFAYLGEEDCRKVVIENPRKIAEGIEDLRPVPEGLHAPTLDGADEEIVSMTYVRAHKIYGDPLPAIVKERLEKELKAIVDNGFSALYLIAQKLVRKSLDDGYLVGSRGSVGSSLVATMCDITEVNPLPPHYVCPKCCWSEFFLDGSVGAGMDLPNRQCPSCGEALSKQGLDIPFETFLGFRGDKVPDIDLNFSGEYQSQVHKYTEELFGSDHVYRAGTIATIADRTAYGFVRKYLDSKGITARNATINKLVRGCTGVRRTTGQHPGGMMVVPQGREIYEFTPIQRPANDVNNETITTHFDYHAISERLVKLDILGHDDPTTLRMLGDLTGVDVRAIPLDDPDTMAIFSRTDTLGISPEDIGTSVGTLGIPEFGTRFVRGMLEETRPKSFSELVRISGFSHGTNVWNSNAQDLIKNGVADITQAIATRDDIMNYLIHNGMEPSDAFQIMERVRKGKGLQDKDIEKMKEAGVPQWYIDSCLKISYLFPKAHAAAYVTMAFRIAYFKVHYPEAFYATYFTVKADEFDAHLVRQGKQKIKETIEALSSKGNDATAKDKGLVTVLEIVLEAMARGIRFLPVALYESDATRFLITEDGLLPPLVSLQGLGKSAAESIVKCRSEGEFTSIEDLRQRTGISRAVIEIMSEHGCLAGLPESNQLTLF